MAREERTRQPEKSKRQPEPDREGPRRGGKNTEEQVRELPLDKEAGPVRRGEKRK